MSIPRYLSIFADFLSSTGILNISGGGTGLSTTPTSGQIDIGNGSGFTRTTLTAGTGVSISNGSGSITISAGLTQTSAVTLSGTSAIVSSIPSTAKRVMVTFNGVTQSSGSAIILLQLGTSSGLVSTSSYYGSAASAASSPTTYATGIGFFSAYSSVPFDGTITLINVGSNNWVCNGISGSATTLGTTTAAIALSSALTQIGLVTNGVSTFSGGTLSIIYE
jgi:hypothetical protein